jgi:hypothetical protein
MFENRLSNGGFPGLGATVKTLVGLIAAATMLVVSAPATAAVELVTNGSFENVGVTTKTKFGAANVAGWSIDKPSSLTYLDTPGSADNGSYLSVYGPFAATSPDGGNFVMMDGDPSYSATISQVITNLTIGQTYQLNFLQAAGQQQGFTGPTTERWQVKFGNQTQLSDQYFLPQGGVGDWQSQTMMFTASATSQTLSFLAKGTPNGAPPIAFLDGVSMQSVPEPATWMMMILGFGAVGVAVRRTRKIGALA